MIEEVPVIKISGIEYPVYAVDFVLGGPNGPSTATVSFVNKNGIYITPSLNTENKTQIEFGNSFSFTGFPVSYTESNSSGGKILTITYWDTSIILDKIFVGLRGVHGAPAASSINISNTTAYGKFNGILLLGNYIDPCQEVEEDYVDPCNPCLNITDFQTLTNNNTQKYIDCEVARLTQILDVIYSFNELISGLRGKGINFYNVPVVKESYYGRYTGTAREVLKSWCQDLGLTFIWENDSVYFIDLKSGLIINDTNFYNSCSLLETSVSKSIENVSSNGVVLYFGADGGLETYNCSGAKFNALRLSLLPITLKDLFWSNAPTGSGLQSYIKKYYTTTKTGENSIIPLQIATFLTKYSPTLRDLTLMYEYYEIDEVGESLAGKDMPLIGMKIKEAWRVGSSTSTPTNAPMLKTLYYEHIPEQIRYLAEKLGAAMAIIEYDQEKHEKFIGFESKLSDFMGRYWISFFSKGDQYSYNSPGGSVDYFDAGTPNTLPFSDLIPVSSRSISTFFQNIVEDSAQKNKGTSHVGAVETTNPNSFAKSFLLLDRQASWEPTPQYEDIVKLNNDLQNVHPYNFAPFKIEGAGDELAKNEYYCLIFDKPGTFDLLDMGEGDHPVEKEAENMITEVGGYTTSYGIRSARCKAYQLKLIQISSEENVPNWNYSINFYLPPQSHDTFGSNYPGFGVIAIPNAGESDGEQAVFIQKKEVIFGDCPNPDSQAVMINIDYKDISSILLEILESGGEQCVYNTESIQNLIAQYYMNTTRTKSIVSETRSYTIGGLPTRELSFLDGVSSYNLRYGSDGLTSNISFSNIPPTPKSENLQNREFERNMMRRYVKKKIALSKDKILV